MTEDHTTPEVPPTDGTTTSGPAAAATADALESVATSEQVVERTAGTEQVADRDLVGDGQLPLEGIEEPSGEVVIDDVTMRRALEAILMVTDEPLPVLTLARAVGRPPADVAEALTGLSEEYTEQGRGFDLREIGGGWRFYTRPEQAPYVERFVLDGQQARLTQAALETLAVVAYKQPVSRARVSAIRGVNVDGVMRTLISRGLVEEASADTESQATLYRTSSYFLERMGMQSLDDLPDLAPYLPEMDDVEEELAAQNTTAQNTTTEATTGESPGQAAGAGVGDMDPGQAAGAEGEAIVAPGAIATPDADEAVTSDIGAALDPEAAAALDAGDAPFPAEGDDTSDEDQLEPAEELEAGGDTELAQEEADPAEFPETGDVEGEEPGAGEGDSTDDEQAGDAGDGELVDDFDDQVSDDASAHGGSDGGLGAVDPVDGFGVGEFTADANAETADADDDAVEDAADADDGEERLQPAEELIGDDLGSDGDIALDLGAAEDLQDSSGTDDPVTGNGAAGFGMRAGDDAAGADERAGDGAGRVERLAVGEEPGAAGAQYRSGSDD